MGSQRQPDVCRLARHRVIALRCLLLDMQHKAISKAAMTLSKWAVALLTAGLVPASPAGAGLEWLLPGPGATVVDGAWARPSLHTLEVRAEPAVPAIWARARLQARLRVCG